MIFFMLSSLDWKKRTTLQHEAWITVNGKARPGNRPADAYRVPCLGNRSVPPVPRETGVKPFSRREENRPQRFPAMISAGYDIWRSQMTALVQAFSRFSAATNIETETLKVLTVFCCAGLVVSLLCATWGLDLSPGSF
jgi:hypothetical protein